jgi:hypothetical protein
LFVRFYVDTRGRTKTTFGNAIHYLQRVLDDSLNRANKVAKRVSIKDDRFLTKFKKDMLIQVAEEYRSEVHDLHASLSTQIRPKNWPLLRPVKTRMSFLICRPLPSIT